MIYLIGGAPRTGKSILAQRLAAALGVGWISTDLLMDLLRTKGVEGTKREWDASAEAIAANAEWFFPCLERFVWGVSSMADGYVIEGVDFLPAQVECLEIRFPISALSLGCSAMSLDRFDRFPGRSLGYAALPDEMRRRIASDIPQWSEVVRLEAERWGARYLDMSHDFDARLSEAEALLAEGRSRAPHSGDL